MMPRSKHIESWPTCTKFFWLLAAEKNRKKNRKKIEKKFEKKFEKNSEKIEKKVQKFLTLGGHTDTWGVDLGANWKFDAFSWLN